MNETDEGHQIHCLDVQRVFSLSISLFSLNFFYEIFKTEVLMGVPTAITSTFSNCKIHIGRMDAREQLTNKVHSWPPPAFSFWTHSKRKITSGMPISSSDSCAANCRAKCCDPWSYIGKINKNGKNLLLQYLLYFCFHLRGVGCKKEAHRWNTLLCFKKSRAQGYTLTFQSEEFRLLWE